MKEHQVTRCNENPKKNKSAVHRESGRLGGPLPTGATKKKKGTSSTLKGGPQRLHSGTLAKT